MNCGIDDPTCYCSERPPGDEATVMLPAMDEMSLKKEQFMRRNLNAVIKTGQYMKAPEVTATEVAGR
jgi:hypothetical protein